MPPTGRAAKALLWKSFREYEYAVDGALFGAKLDRVDAVVWNWGALISRHLQ